MKTIAILLLSFILLPVASHAQITLDCYALDENEEQLNYCDIVVYKNGDLVYKTRRGHLNVELELGQYYSVVVMKNGFVAKGVSIDTHTENHVSLDFPLAVVVNYTDEEYEQPIVQVGSVYYNETTQNMAYRPMLDPASGPD